MENTSSHKQIPGEQKKRSIASRHWEKRSSDAPVYFDLIVEHGHWRQAGIKGLRLLDVGCAAGRDTAYFRGQGLIAQGFDINEKFIKEAINAFPGIMFEVGDALSLPYDENTFSVIYCVNTLFHLKAWQTALSEFFRVLKADGIVAISFDVLIVNEEENWAVHEADLNDLREWVSKNGRCIRFLSEERKRMDPRKGELYAHTHYFHDMLLSF